MHARGPDAHGTNARHLDVPPSDAQPSDIQASDAQPSGAHASDLRGELRKLSHDVKNALHGVSVNLEVARTRMARGVIDADQVLPFLDSAAQQLDTATALYKQVYERFSALAASSS
jgi:hypothetical protein